MNDIITVKLPLMTFDSLREGDKAFKNLAHLIASCYDYKVEKELPDTCRKCEELECSGCETYKGLETLTVDVDKLIDVTKMYALYGKNIDTDLDEIKVVRKGTKDNEIL